MQPSVLHPLSLAAALMLRLLSLDCCSTADAFSASRVVPSSSRRAPLAKATTPATSTIAAITRLHSTAAEESTSSSSSSSSLSSSSSSGVSKTTIVEGTGRLVRPGDAVVVKYRCSVAPSASGSSSSEGSVIGGGSRPFARSDRQRMVALDGSMIRGWDMAMRTMREGERCTALISDPIHAYGEEGVPPFVPSNSAIFIDMEVLNIEEDVMGGGGGGRVGALSGSSDIAGLDAMLDGPASRPRTPAAIAAAYERRMKEKAMSGLPPERDGIGGWIDKVKGSYFFGLFEGETGQEAPWYLTPSITFPIAFAVVGIAFWASLAGGAISERGMPSTDELDEIIVSSGDLLRFSGIIALAMVNDIIQA